MGTLGVHMKGVLPWLVRWARHAGTIEYCPALAVLVNPVQNTIFLNAHFFTCISVSLDMLFCGLFIASCVSYTILFNCDKGI
jgi:hypothetical protein